MKKTSLKTDFGSTVRGRRAALGISQEQLAEQASLHRTYISDIERGARNLSLESICKLAEALQVSVADLFSASTFSPEAGLSADKQVVDILLVEDNPDDVAITLRAFKKARFFNRVHVAPTAEDAADYLFCQGAYASRNRADRPQLILLDLHLPRMSGIELLRRIRADKDTRTISVVVLTISQRSRDMEECLRLGVDNYIVKPVDFQRLIEVTPKLELDWALLKHTMPLPVSDARKAGLG